MNCDAYDNIQSLSQKAESYCPDCENTKTVATLSTRDKRTGRDPVRSTTTQLMYVS
jgi:hypothetical protein